MSQKQSKRTRIALGCGIAAVSLIIGLGVGLKISFSSKTNLTTEDKIVQILKDEWFSEIYYEDITDEDAIIAQFVSSIYNMPFSKQLDPYTYIYQNVTTTSPTYTGKMGITITKTFGYPVITKIEKNSPADGVLLVDDIVLGIGKETEDHQIVYHYIEEEDYDFTSLFTYGSGNIGDERYIQIARPTTDGKYEIKEEKIVLQEAGKTQYTYVEDCSLSDTLMVKLTGFTSLSSEDDTAGQFKAILEENEQSSDKKNNLIIDLRDNGGGDLSSLVDVCDLFLPEKKLVTTLEMKDGSTSSRYTKDSTAYEFDHMIILMNENSASASEILIACLDYYFDQVTLVGSTSYGKGIAQKTISIGSNLYLQYTFAKWYAPDGTWIHKVGIDPTSEEDQINRSELLKTMNTYNNTLYYDTGIYQLDQVRSYHLALAEILNAKYDYAMRTDGYFDESYQNYIMQYQTLKNIPADGMINQNTYIYFILDYLKERNLFDEAYLLRSEELLLQ